MREPISRLFFAHLKNDSRESLNKYSKTVDAWIDFARPVWSDKESATHFPVVTCLLRSHQETVSCSSARSENNEVSVFTDGYVANKDELINLLPSEYREKAQGSNAELLLGLYANLGEDFIKHLNGWYAVIIIDKTRQKAFAGIDRFGMYPLYIYQNNDGVFLSSDIHMLFQMNIAPANLDMKGLSDYWVYGGVLEDRTLFENIYRVPPATIWSFDMTGGNQKIYFDFDSLGDKGPITETDKAVRTATELMADLVPRYFKEGQGTNFFLSGGWDTRAIASYLDDEAKKDALCIIYGCDQRSKDYHLARKISDYLGCDHQYIQIGKSFLDWFPSLAFDAVYLTDGFGCVQNAISLFLLDSIKHPTGLTVTGKFGSEFIRGAEGVLGNHDLAMINPDLQDFIRQQSIAPRPDGWFGDKTISYHQHLMRRLDECRSVWAGNQLAERYKTWTATPYLDNEMVDLMFRMPESLRQGDNLIHSLALNDQTLSAMPSNRGEFAGKHGKWDSMLGLYYHSLWNLSLVTNSTRLPPYLKADLLPFPTQRISKWKTWFRDNFQSFVKEILLDPRTIRRNIFDPKLLQNTLAGDLSQMRNLVVLNRMLSIEVLHRLFID